MTETVVHVTTLDQWKSVLDVWFSQGYTWQTDDRRYSGFIFSNGARYLHLDSYISYTINEPNEFIEYTDFMSQQEKTMAKETYYVTQEQLDLIKGLKKGNWPLTMLVNSEGAFEPLNNGLEMIEEKALLRYLGGDTSIEFKVKEQLYRLWRIDDDGDKVWFMLLDGGEPDWTLNASHAFTAPLEEIEKWKTPAWEIEEAN